MLRKLLLKALKRYLATTSLHGFKYLRASYKEDIVLWSCWCVASACCGGVLCAVLWARFIQIPTLLELRSTDFRGTMPSVGLCLKPQYVAAAFVSSINHTEDNSIKHAFSKALRGAPAPDYQLSYLEYLFKKHDLTLQTLLLNYTPTCRGIIKKCRMDSKVVPCDEIARRDLTAFGACCIILPSHRTKMRHIPKVTQLEVILQSYSQFGFPEYELITEYTGRGWVRSTVVHAGFIYHAPMLFEAIHSGDDQSIMESTCIADTTYSRSSCLEKCVERQCGCLDPLGNTDTFNNLLQPCTLAQIACLRNIDEVEIVCKHCLPPCKNTRTYMSVKQTTIDAHDYVFDSFYSCLDPNTSIVINMQVNQIGSHVYRRRPTESWLTLLSSLGGVFNMFLGVGLFSALELIYFVFIRIPIAMRQSLEIQVV